MEKKDWCTWFFERFPTWDTWYKFKVIDISPCCKEHDETCSFHKFIKCLWSNKVVGTTWIALGGTLGCIVRYPYITVKRWF